MLRRPCLTSSGATTPHLTPVTWPIWGEHMATKMQCAQFTRAPSAMVGYHGRPRTLAKQTLMGTGKCIWIIHPTCLTQCFQHQNDPKGTNQVTYEKSCAKKKCARFYGYIFFVLVCIFCVPNLGLSTFFCTKGRSRIYIYICRYIFWALQVRLRYIISVHKAWYFPLTNRKFLVHRVSIGISGTKLTMGVESRKAECSRRPHWVLIRTGGWERRERMEKKDTKD